MLACLGWIGTALAAGLLLQIAVQIHALHWLPDFPVYLGLALLSAAVSLLAVPLAFVVAVGKSFPAGNSPVWLRALTLVGFTALALSHALLAAGSSSTALEWWRNVVLWPTLLTGIVACLLNGPRWTSLLVLWPLGETATAILACWYAPSFGESQSFRAYQYVLSAAAISFLMLVPATIIDRRALTPVWLWAFVAATAALAFVCLLQPDSQRAQTLMMGAATLRWGVLLVVVGGWLKHFTNSAVDNKASQG